MRGSRQFLLCFAVFFLWPGLLLAKLPDNVYRPLYDEVQALKKKYQENLKLHHDGKISTKILEEALLKLNKAKSRLKEKTPGNSTPEVHEPTVPDNTTITTDNTPKTPKNTTEIKIEKGPVREEGFLQKLIKKGKTLWKDIFSKEYDGKPFEEEINAVVIAKQALNLRTLPGTHGKSITALPRGAIVKALGRSGNWILIEYNGVSGFAHGGYLRRIPPDGKLPDENSSDMAGDKVENEALPDHRNPVKYPEGSVNTHNSEFSSWLKNALKGSKKLNANFPDSLKNRYGQTITREMAIKSVLFNETRGVHSLPNGGVIQNKAGFTGWMQISKIVAVETLKKKFNKWKDPDWNLLAGTKYLGTCLNAASPPPRKWKMYCKGDTDEERLIKAIVGYNRGPYGRRMKKPWKEIVAATKPSHRDYMAEGVNYGLQSKMAMGLKLTSAEKQWLIKYSPRLNSVSDVDKRAALLFSYNKHM
ncbi:SH3 domain-containing protein [Candidatus Riflebacteria bacterium]